ncbi:hypothetical protein H4R26_005287 [Coemansia thaxteri]|uniref:Uncharacterized protein n=1 Tax=Coemansia thaxteri TaxID=2663907 RepID=A0A9W8B907_9FUNG|nr:hypothetical protein H4R26_005287 [Coemansia thaxteri]KAJ2475804.1 hypothetical protein EV174_005144 [Coemansia sp. RSA 2320]
MFGYSVPALALVVIYAAVAAGALPHQAAGHVETRSTSSDVQATLLKRCGCGSCGFFGGCSGFGGCGGLYRRQAGLYGRYGGFFFPFASSVTTDFDRNANRANFNDNTLYVNNVNANVANDNAHAFTKANVVA